LGNGVLNGLHTKVAVRSFVNGSGAISTKNLNGVFIDCALQLQSKVL
jgi:hypothetical protein